MPEPDNLVIEHLRAIRGEIAKISDWMSTISAELTAVRQHLGGVVTIQDHDHAEIAAIKVRIDRIERRIELVDEE